MKQKKEQDSQQYRKKISLVGQGPDQMEFSEALSTDLKKLNENKFFFNLKGDNNPSSKD